MGKRPKNPALNADEATRFASKVMKMAADDTENQILEMIRRDPSLGPRVLTMLQKGMLNQQAATSADRIPPGSNKWNLLGKERCITLLNSLTSNLSQSLLEKWTKKDVETLLSFALDVEDSSALPSKRMSGVQEWVTTRAQEVGGRLRNVALTDDTPQKVDWQKFGVFEVVEPESNDMPKVIRHRLTQSIKVSLPAEFAAASSLTLVGNYSASKAMLKTDFTTVSVAKIFKRDGVELPMPLFEKSVSEAASSPRSSTASLEDNASVRSPGMFSHPSPTGTSSPLPMPLGGSGSASARADDEQ